MGEAKGNIVIFDGSFETTAFIRRLMQGLIAHGHRVTVIGFNEYNSNPVSGVVYQSLGSNQSKQKLLITSFKLVLKYGSWPQVLKVIKAAFKGHRKDIQQQNLFLVFKAIKPDVVHVQWPSLLPWMAPYLSNSNFKIVLSQRGFHVNVRPFVNAKNYAYLQRIYPKLDGLHSVSQAISKVGKTIGIPETGIDHVVYTGCNLENIPFKLKDNKQSPLLLLSVGRAHWIKDYPTAIRACIFLKAKQINFHYTIIGGQGDEELRYLIHELGLEEQVRLVDNMEHEHVMAQIQDADILISSSIQEGLVNVAVEAMALGTPVISTNCGGMPELITHNVTGWLVPVGVPEDLSNQVIMVHALSSEHLNTITKAARLKVEKQHTENNMIVGMEKLYKTVLKS